MNKEEINIEIFKGFTEDQLIELKTILTPCHYSNGEVIIRQNQRAEDLFIVINGEVEIRHRPYDGPVLTVGKISSGGVFGWSAILGRSDYSSTVTAMADCVLYRINGRKLQGFCEHHHETGVVLLEKMALSVAQQPAQIHEQIMKLLQFAMECPNNY